MKDLYYEALKDTDERLFTEIQKPYNSRYHFHRAFELAYITEGSAHYQIEGIDFVAECDDIVFAHCYYAHRGYADREHVKYIIAVPENLSHDISKILRDKALPAHMSDKDFNKKILPHIKALIEADASTPKILIKGHLNLIFGYLSEHYEMVDISRKNKRVMIIADILSYIDTHINEQITLESLAREFGYNKSYFSRLFNDHLGISLNNYVNFVRLNRFEQLMAKNSDKSVTELIYEAGFSSTTTFYRAKSYRTKSREK